MRQQNLIAVIGLQWGDEGKGKVVDAIATDVCVRYNGGPNAGHTILIGDDKIVTHNLPSGIAREAVVNLVGPNVVCSPQEVLKELEIARMRSASVFLDPQCLVILPIHIQIDRGREEALGNGKLGTTTRGIGPCYEDQVARRGVTVGDLRRRELVEGALRRGDYYGERMALARHLGMAPMSLEETLNWCMQYQALAELCTDTALVVQDAIADGQRVLFEGAQGVMLDVLAGARPYVTSSSCGRGVIGTTFGVHEFDRVIGIAKAYTTRVGAGSFPTELTDALGTWLRDKGVEFGATTGRPRRVGWQDLVVLAHGCHRGGIREVVVTKLDVLGGMDEILICTGYTIDGVPVRGTLTESVLAQATPEYVVLTGWEEDISGCRRFEDLPEAAQDYIAHIEEYLDLPVTGIGVGPERSQMIWRTPVG